MIDISDIQELSILKEVVITPTSEILLIETIEGLKNDKVFIPNMCGKNSIELKKNM